MNALRPVSDAASTRRAIEVLVEAFLDDPFFVWTTPEPAARASLLRSLFSLAVSAAGRRGFLTSCDRGVVVLVAPHRELYDAAEAAAAAALQRAAFQRPAGLLEDYTHRIRHDSPQFEDAWYLQYLAVPADRRSRGHGSSLMRDVLTQTGDGLLWLHTGRPENLGFYAGFGLRVVAETPCDEGGPIVYTLLRSPRAAP